MKIILNLFVLIIGIAVLLSSCAEEDSKTVSTTNPSSSSDSSASSATAIAAGLSHSCVLLDNASVKCWGHNNRGQLGIDNNTRMGDGSSEMGDNLSVIDL